MQSTFYFQFIHLLFFQISKFTTFKPIQKTELMQFFWTAVKLIIPLSSCVFFQRKNAIHYPVFLPKRHLARKNYLRQPPKNSYQWTSTDVRWSSDCKVPTKANQLLPSLRPLFFALTRVGELARYIQVLVELSRNSQKFKKIDFFTLNYGGKLVRFGSLKLLALNYRGKGRGSKLGRKFFNFCR